jgi:hypothetical protein
MDALRLGICSCRTRLLEFFKGVGDGALLSQKTDIC